MIILQSADRERLVKILGLLASDKSGERDAAAHASVRLLRSLDLAWNDVIGAGNPQPQRPLYRPWRDTVRACRQQAGGLRIWERNYLASIEKQATLSAKQRALLQEIAARVLHGNAA